MTEIPAAAYADRRRRVLSLLGDDAALVLPAAPEARIGLDLELRYRPDPDLLYLTGFREPEAVAVLCPAFEEAPFTLFVRPRDPGAELWSGPRAGPEAARERTGADAGHLVAELEDRLQRILQDVDTVHLRFRTAARPIQDLVLRMLDRGAEARRRHGRGPVRLHHAGLLLDDLRLTKDSHELAVIRRAARLTAEGVRTGAAAIRPGAGEWEVEAAVEAAFRRQGGHGPGFATIVAAGANATVLHYIENGSTMFADDLLLVDAGAHVEGYNGDLSRTFPVAGRFSPRQRDLYDAVLAAHDAAIDAVRPGASIADVHQAAVRVLVGAMLDHGLVDGSVDEIVEDEDRYKPFFPHRTSHWLGLDVHDVGDYIVRGEPRRLQPGMVLTVEPGLYIPRDRDDAAEPLRGIGIRLEDDVLVTDAGAEVLTADMPIRPDQVEDLLAANEGTG